MKLVRVAVKLGTTFTTWMFEAYVGEELPVHSTTVEYFAIANLLNSVVEVN